MQARNGRKKERLFSQPRRMASKRTPSYGQGMTARSKEVLRSGTALTSRNTLWGAVIDLSNKVNEAVTIKFLLQYNLDLTGVSIPRGITYPPFGSDGYPIISLLLPPCLPLLGMLLPSKVPYHDRTTPPGTPNHHPCSSRQSLLQSLQRRRNARSQASVSPCLD